MGTNAPYNDSASPTPVRSYGVPVISVTVGGVDVKSIDITPAAGYMWQSPFLMVTTNDASKYTDGFCTITDGTNSFISQAFDYGSTNSGDFALAALYNSMWATVTCPSLEAGHQITITMVYTPIFVGQ